MMDELINARESDVFPYDASDLGEIAESEKLCPGMFYIRVNSDDPEHETEYYIVDKQADYISGPAKTYGLLLSNEDSVLAFPCNAERGGKHILEYEMLRYKVKNGIADDSGETLLSLSTFGRERYPEYFGRFPAPMATPRGVTTRFQALQDGVFVLETDQCEKMLAVCFPIADSAFSPFTLERAEQTDYDQTHGLENTYGYIFFPNESMCLALFELLRGYRDLRSCKLLNIPALYNAIWENYPEYAVNYNSEEQLGFHDIFGTIFAELGCQVELGGSADNLIPIVADAGLNYLRF